MVNAKKSDDLIWLQFPLLKSTFSSLVKTQRNERDLEFENIDWIFIFLETIFSTNKAAENTIKWF